METVLFVNVSVGEWAPEGMTRDALPQWFHRANWAGGALACLAIGAFPLLRWGYSIPALIWGFVWITLGLGAANNARLGLNSISPRWRFWAQRKQ